MKIFNPIISESQFDKRYIKYLRKFVYKHWWHKRHKIDQEYLNHISRKFNVKCLLIEKPKDIELEFFWGKIYVNSTHIKLYMKQFNYNGYKVYLVDDNNNVIDEFNNGLV